jgi:hypothetical protein
LARAHHRDFRFTFCEENISRLARVPDRRDNGCRDKLWEERVASDIWLPLGSSERTLLREALAALSQSGRAPGKLAPLMQKIEKAGPLPETVIRVEGGFVEIEHNPNPILVYDYDCDGEDELGTDECGRPCIASEHEASRPGTPR